MTSDERIKTRILIISDTHAAVPRSQLPVGQSIDDEFNSSGFNIHRTPSGFRHPLPEADVVLHCGDLTKRSEPVEFEATFAMLRGLKAPLKLVIPGNHDGALDRGWWSMWQQPRRDPHMEIPGEAERIVEAARQDGVRYLVEGDYTFNLANGARLRVYASPWTPEYGTWGFQYGDSGHDFSIPAGVDIAMTHGPPQGVLDETRWGGTRAGCDCLFRAIEHSKPRVHCFGHIHEGWGAYLATWKTVENQYNVTTASAIDADQSKFIEEPLPRGYRFPKDPQAQQADIELFKQRARDRAILLDVSDGENKVKANEQTLFVNAAIMDTSYRPLQRPWLLDIDLPKSTPLN